MDYKEAIAELRVPFSNDLVEQNYRGFDFVPPEHVVDRLNDVLGLEWSFSIKSSQSFEGKYFTEVQVLGALSYGPKDARETKEAFGFDTISWESKEGNQYPSPLDKAYKSAASNSMKLCARLCGVGNHL